MNNTTLVILFILTILTIIFLTSYNKIEEFIGNRRWTPQYRTYGYRPWYRPEWYYRYYWWNPWSWY